MLPRPLKARSIPTHEPTHHNDGSKTIIQRDELTAVSTAFNSSRLAFKPLENKVRRHLRAQHRFHAEERLLP